MALNADHELFGDVRTQLDALITEDKLQMNLHAAPLLTLKAVYAPASEHSTAQHFLILQYHHLVMDHISVDILMEEVQAYIDGQTSRMAAPLPYRNFVAHALVQANREEGPKYFSEQLSHIDTVTAPFAISELDNDAHIEEAIAPLDADVSQQIYALSQQYHISPATLFHLAWGLVVSRTSETSKTSETSDDVVFGTVMSGRLQGTEGAGRIFGMFLNMLPLRLSFERETTVDAAIHATHKALIGLLPFEQTPLTVAQQCSGVASGSPLFSAMLNYRHSGKGVDNTGDTASDDDSGMDRIEAVGGYERTNYPFTCSVDDLGNNFILTLQVDARVGAARMLEYMQQALTGLTNALAKQPSQALASIDILPASEREQLLSTFNQTDAAYPRDASIPALFEHYAGSTPDAIAVRFNDTSLTYAQLNTQANGVDIN